MNQREIYLAGGCFWGTEAYLKRIPGVLETEVGYAISVHDVRSNVPHLSLDSHEHAPES